MCPVSNDNSISVLVDSINLKKREIEWQITLLKQLLRSLKMLSAEINKQPFTDISDIDCLKSMGMKINEYGTLIHSATSDIQISTRAYLDTKKGT